MSGSNYFKGKNTAKCYQILKATFQNLLNA
jgi:hypothetical protein